MKDKMKTALAVLLFSVIFAFAQPAAAKIYIDITGVSGQSLPIAVVPPLRDAGDEDPKKLSEEFVKTVRGDLELMGLFRWIDEKAFLESPGKKALTAREIDFASWAVLDAMALVKGWYRVDGKKLTLEARLFDVLARSEIAAKRYDTTVDRITEVGHRFADEIMKALTGEEGVFGTKMAFICSPKKKKELCLMNFDGSGMEQLTRDNSIVLSPAWAQNGKSVFYTSFGREKSPQLYRYNLDRPSPLRISAFPGMAIGLAVDPIGGTLATALTKDGNSEIYLLTFGGEIQKRLTVNNHIDVSASFSPDGKSIAFVSDRDGYAQIYKMNRDGSGVQRLTFKGNNNTSPAWSPKGDKIAFAGMDTDGHFDIFSMNIDGSGMTRLTYDAKNNIEPSWAPGAQLITFASDRAGVYQIWSMRPDGSKPMQLTHEAWNHNMPVWGPRTK